MRLWEFLRRTRHSIKYPVLLAAIIPALLMFGLLTTNFLYDQTNAIYKALDKEGKLLVSHLATTSEYGLATGNTEYLKGIATQLVKEAHVNAVRIVNQNDAVVVRVAQNEPHSTQKRRLLRFESPVFLEQIDEHTFDLFDGGQSNLHAPNDGRPSPRYIGTVELELSMHQADAERRTVIWRGVTLGLLSLLVASIVGVRIADTFTKRVINITGAIRRIRNGVYDHHAAQGDLDDDELAHLSSDVDDLAKELTEAKTRLQLQMSQLIEAREGAEHLVSERTRALVSARDEAVAINEENRKLIQEMNRLLEEERRHIAREIHDQLNAVLVAIKLELQRIQKRLTNVEKPTEVMEDVQARIVNILDMVATTYTIARQITHRLRPEVIDAMGLRGALEDMVNDYNSLHAECHFELQIADRVTEVGDNASMAIYRIVQEALTNTVRHSGASHVNITIQTCNDREATSICVTVEDNGKGFDVGKKARGIGILSMRERAVGLGGTFVIESLISAGTSVRASIPLWPDESDHEGQ